MSHTVTKLFAGITLTVTSVMVFRSLSISVAQADEPDCSYETIVDACEIYAPLAGIDTWRCEADLVSCYMNVIIGDESYECGYDFFNVCGTVGGSICGWYDFVGGMIPNLECPVRPDRPDVDPSPPDDAGSVTIDAGGIPAPDCSYEAIDDACRSGPWNLVDSAGMYADRCSADLTSCYMRVVLGDESQSCGYNFNQACGQGYVCGWYDFVGAMNAILDCE